VELSEQQLIFVGFRLEGSLRHQVKHLVGPDQKYVSQEDFTFLTICRKGDVEYLGKVVEERLSTDRVDDVRRNVLSIVARLCPDVRLPQHLEIWACRLPAKTEPDNASEPEVPPFLDGPIFSR